MKIISVLKNFVNGKYFILHSVLLAVFPILFLYSQNIAETTADQVFLPLAFTLAGTVVLWILLGLLMKNAVKAGIAVTLFLVFFFSYGRLYDLLEKWGVFVPSHAHLLPVLLFICGYGIYFIAIARRDFRNTNKILNFIAAVLILINLGSLAFFQFSKPTESADQTASPPGTPGIKVDSETTAIKPDVYYIILDEYAHPDTMKEYYNYDNSGFIKFLEDKGFYWASQSKTKTNSTFTSIASSLNMEYISNDESNTFVFEKIANAEVVKIFNSLGYSVIHFGSWFDSGLFKINNATRFNLYDSTGESMIISQFPRVFWNTTMLAPFYDYLIENQFNTTYRDGLLRTIDQLKTMPAGGHPKFVFAHIISPHEPLVFGANGEYVPLANWDNFEDKRFYLGQYKFITARVQELVDSLIHESPDPPIIIIQSDHGLRFGRTNFDIGDKEWEKILNVYYLPGDSKNMLYKTISPVNTFRIIFNNYFGMNLELLKE